MSQRIDPKDLDALLNTPGLDLGLAAYYKWMAGLGDLSDLIKEGESTVQESEEQGSGRCNRWVGPTTRGKKGHSYISYFDSKCVYGNEINMSAEQVKCLEHVLDSTNPIMKLYVCRMNKTFTTPG